MADADLTGILRDAMEVERDGFTLYTLAPERSTGTRIASRAAIMVETDKRAHRGPARCLCYGSRGTQVSQVAGGGVGTRGWVTSGKLSWSPSLVIRYGESQIPSSSASIALYPPQ